MAAHHEGFLEEYKARRSLTSTMAYHFPRPPLSLESPCFSSFYYSLSSFDSSIEVQLIHIYEIATAKIVHKAEKVKDFSLKLEIR